MIIKSHNLLRVKIKPYPNTYPAFWTNSVLLVITMEKIWDDQYEIWIAVALQKLPDDIEYMNIL